MSELEIDRQALNVFGRLLDRQGDVRYRERLLLRVPEPVRRRLIEIETAHDRQRWALPTEPPVAAPVEPLNLPERIGPFRLTRCIGQGGMGEVWRADRDDGLFDQVVAIKLLRLSLDARSKDAFDGERRNLARLDHPNVVRLIDGGVTAEGLPYLTMDFVTGEHLDQAWAGLALANRVALIVEAANAVQYAHGKLVAHGDLKPSNILVDGLGRVRLLDFGISRLLGGEVEADAGRGAMTRAYSSPQRLEGAPPSIADDVYALGILLGQAVGETTDGEVKAVIAKATAADEAARYQTAADLVADIGRWQTGRPLRARPNTALYRMSKFVRRNLLLVLVTAGVFLVLLTAAITATLAQQRAERARIEASARFEDARGVAHYLVFTVIDRLEEHPNTLNLRREAADVAQHYLDRLEASRLAQVGGDPSYRQALRREIAQGLIRLAEAEGVPSFQNVDRPDAAAQDLQRAIALLSPDKQPGAATLQVKAMVELALLQSYAQNRSDLALAELDQAQHIIQTHPEISDLQRARVLLQTADAQAWRSQFPASVAASKAALQKLGADTSLDASLGRAEAVDFMTQNQHDADGEHASVAAFSAGFLKEVGMLEDTAKRFPGSRRANRNLARARWQYGSSLASAKAGLPVIEKAAAEMQAIADYDHDDTDALRIVGYMNVDRAKDLARLGRSPEALTIMRSNITNERAQAAAHPVENQWLRDLIIDLGVTGEMETEHGQVTAGCRDFAEFHRQVQAINKLADPSGLYLQGDIAAVVSHEKKYCAVSPHGA